MQQEPPGFGAREQLLRYLQGLGRVDSSAPLLEGRRRGAGGGGALQSSGTSNFEATGDYERSSGAELLQMAAHKQQSRTSHGSTAHRAEPHWCNSDRIKNMFKYLVFNWTQQPYDLSSPYDCEF